MDCKNFLAEFKEYLTRLFWFCLVSKYLFYYVGSLFSILLFPVIVIILIIIRTFIDIDQISESQSLDICINTGVYVASFSALYFLAKVFGIFKKLDKLNFFIAFVIICAISHLLVLIGRINFLISEILYQEGLEYFYTMYFLVPAFILYKFFNLLTKNFQIFQKIGYYTSIEFVKNVCGKIKGKFAKENR